MPEQWWRAWPSIPSAYQLLGFLEYMAVGVTGGFHADEAEVVELISLWVASAARGHGVGNALVDVVEEWAPKYYCRCST